jgi:hypothetical protein
MRSDICASQIAPCHRRTVGRISRNRQSDSIDLEQESCSGVSNSRRVVTIENAHIG